MTSLLTITVANIQYPDTTTTATLVFDGVVAEANIDSYSSVTPAYIILY